MTETPLRAIRIPDELWRAAMTRAHDAGHDLSTVIRHLLQEWLNTPKGPGLD